MKIAYIAHLSELSGAGIALLDSASGLKNQNISGTLILPGDGPLLQRARNQGMTTLTISNPETDIASAGFAGKLRLIKQRLTYIRALRHHLKSGKYTLAYVNSAATVFAGIAAKLAGVPIVWHVHETYDNPTRAMRVKSWLIRQLSRGILYASQSAMDCFPHPSHLPGLVVLNPIDTENLLPIGENRIATHKPPAAPLLLANGTFHRKGTDVLLAALEILQSTPPPPLPTLQITGPPPFPANFARQLSDLLAKHNLTEQVQFTGVQPSLVPYYEKATLYISASRNEALPIAIVEAMACGVPVIATDVGDCRRLLDNGECGRIVPPEDPTALASAIRAALQNPAQTQEKAARAFQKIRTVYGSPDFWVPLSRFLQQITR